jgi:CheY-like chemotaxis protein
MGHERVLLVEDDDNDRRLVLAAFQELGLAGAVGWAADGQDALDWLHRRGPHAGRAGEAPRLVLLDLKMPRVDGFGVLAHLRADPALRLLPVVVFSSSREAGDIARSYALGGNGYVVKPADYAALTGTLSDVVRYWLAVNVPAN